MRAAVKPPIAFHTVPNYATRAVGARRSQLLNSAFKTVEEVRSPLGHDFKAFIVFIVTCGALAHRRSPTVCAREPSGQRKRRRVSSFRGTAMIPLSKTPLRELRIELLRNLLVR